jgi:hypothetical protein
MNTDMAQEQSSVRIDKPTPAEAELLRLLSPAEKLATLVEAAAKKAGQLDRIARAIKGMAEESRQREEQAK